MPKLITPPYYGIWRGLALWALLVISLLKITGNAKLITPPYYGVWRGLALWALLVISLLKITGNAKINHSTLQCTTDKLTPLNFKIASPWLLHHPELPTVCVTCPCGEAAEISLLWDKNSPSGQLSCKKIKDRSAVEVLRKSDSQYLQNQSESMPRRLEDVISREGNPTNY